MTKEERIKKLENRLEEMKQLERGLFDKGYKLIAGCDEVGRGPLAGPVVAAAVVLPRGFNILGVDDSKKVSEKKRKELNELILEKALAYGFGMRDNTVIDEINILEATKLAMIDAIREADAVLKKKGLEGVDFVLFDAMKIPKVEIPQESIIKGDSKSVSIAAASIIAKVKRDAMMVEYSKIYPNYSFESNKGYGTKAHYEGLRENGLTPIHRKSFLKNLR